MLYIHYTFIKFYLPWEILLSSTEWSILLRQDMPSQVIGGVFRSLVVTAWARQNHMLIHSIIYASLSLERNKDDWILKIRTARLYEDFPWSPTGLSVTLNYANDTGRSFFSMKVLHGDNRGIREEIWLKIEITDDWGFISQIVGIRQWKVCSPAVFRSWGPENVTDSPKVLFLVIESEIYSNLTKNLLFLSNFVTFRVSFN